MPLVADFRPSFSPLPPAPGAAPRMPGRDATLPARRLECADPDEEEGEGEDLGDEEDLAVSQPLADEESEFDDFDDDFDDDFEEEENDPDWDHPDDTDGNEMPPGKQPGRKR